MSVLMGDEPTTTEELGHLFCHNCGSLSVERTGGLSADVRGPRGLEGVDLDFYVCRDCGEEWAD